MEDILSVIESTAVEKLKKSAFAKEHPNCLVVDAECQLPEEAQEGALCIVRRPEHHIGRDALFVRDSSKWRFRCCGTIPETMERRNIDGKKKENGQQGPCIENRRKSE